MSTTRLALAERMTAARLMLDMMRDGCVVCVELLVLITPGRQVTLARNSELKIELMICCEL